MAMMTIDAQVHAYERDHPGRPWVDVLHGPPEVTGDDMVRAMDTVGVDGALLVSPHTMYRYDASYAIQVRAAHPGRFALIKPVDPSDPAEIGRASCRDRECPYVSLSVVAVSLQKKTTQNHKQLT